MSGWENIPKEKPKAGTPPAQPATPRRRRSSAAARTAGLDPAQIEFGRVEDGEWVRQLEWYFPAAWITMLVIVSLIGIYKALSEVPNGPW